MRTTRLMTFLTITILMFCEFALSQTNSKTDNNSKMEEVKAGIARILNDKLEILDKRTQLMGEPKEIKVMDDRIEFKIKKENIVIHYNEFIDYSIIDPWYKKTKVALEVGQFQFLMSGWTAAASVRRLGELRQYLVYIQIEQKKKRSELQLTQFEQVAAKYRELKVKPPLSEEQRKYIVQANASSQQKVYAKAIELYNKALEVDQTAYPAGYSNLALLYAQINDFDAAIYHMKKYLMLVPEAEDARAAQDKIYEWEAHIAK